MKKNIIILLIISLVGTAYVVAECIKPPDVSDVPFAYNPEDAPARLIEGNWREIPALIEFSFEVPTCDPDGDPVSVSPFYMPIGMTFDPDTSRCYWTPQATQLGINWAAFEAIDEPPAGSTALSDYASMVINVTPRDNTPPVILPFLD